ncbi:host attachment family protein [Phreatobacter stygius]|uniref:Host attachment protein n=1 Tax=Phreatobacter stygius TaxID=1940610 RepID=A0A4D7BN42_9HYPH|nr:host attachment family protein [Phreatobacter stygius]QCI69062.1 host attachment protein [Phreatobacter stygius]
MPAIKIPHDALILIGDGEKALFLRNRGHAQRLDLVIEDVLQQDNPATREQGTDRPGRSFANAGTRRSAMEQTDWHRLGEQRFAIDIAEALRRHAQAARFKELIVIASPRVLGNLRKAFHRDVSDRITGEIAKELTSHPLADIQSLLTA